MVNGGGPAVLLWMDAYTLTTFDKMKPGFSVKH